MNDFATAARSLLEPWVIVMVISCGSVIAAVLLSEARQRMNTRVDLERRNPYFTTDTDAARDYFHKRARIAAERTAEQERRMRSVGGQA